ncbi:PH domain-containing protein [Patulibacter defluvii]|uniref:PH domain-containing protein n=1 Tax=Patulibacter defluvii TaxID=3095358 RepID=UPI002A752700|nr:PH domain-containing protein [Patulibacter sp. DM4]
MDERSPGSAPPLPGDLDRHRLSDRAVAYWRIGAALTAIPLALAATVAVVALDPGGAPTALVAVVAWAAAVAAIVVLPPLRRRRWWYAIGAEEVDLHHGLVVVTRTVVPMVRVQHVDLHRGPLSGRMRLAEIELHTAAGSVTIPALDRDEAERIRRQVATLARIPDDL